MTQFVLILAGIWGVFWAIFLQYHPLGRFLAKRRTWITVVVGVGGDLLLLYAVLDLEDWLLVAAVVGMSSAGIIARSLWNEHAEVERQIDVADRRQAPGE